MKNVLYRILLSGSLIATSISGVMAESYGDLEDGVVRALPANFNQSEISQAIDFCQLAYSAFNAAHGSGDNSENSFEDQVTRLKNEGYSIRTFEAETGHTIFTDAFKKKRVIGVFAERGDQAVIAFRGTKDLRDLITDAYVLNGKMQKSRFLGEERGGVHAGFNHVFKSYEAALTEMFKNSKAKRYHIVGHSLGAALAQLTGLHLTRLKESMKKDIEIKVVSLNAPRVGSPNFAQKLLDTIGVQNIARFTKGKREAVSSLIPGFAGFKHAGTNIVVPSDSWNKLEDHKLGVFKNGAAEEALEAHNQNPVKVQGVRTRIREGFNSFAETVKDAGASAKATFVKGFQSIRRGVANFFGFA